MYFVLALCLFARDSYEEVIRTLTCGLPGSPVLAQVNRSSLSRARARLGEEVLHTLFRKVAPLATPGRDKVERGQWAFNQTTKPKSDRLAGRPYGSKPRAHHTR